MGFLHCFNLVNIRHRCSVRFASPKTCENDHAGEKVERDIDLSTFDLFQVGCMEKDLICKGV